jgi:hypothetical protein
MYKIVKLPQSFRDWNEIVLQVFVRVSTFHCVVQDGPEPSIAIKRTRMGVMVVDAVPNVLSMVLWIDAHMIRMLCMQYWVKRHNIHLSVTSDGHSERALCVFCVF